MANSSAFPFLQLPAEIRLIVYHHLLVWPGPKLMIMRYWRIGGLHPAVLSVNKQIYNEARNILYSRNRASILVYLYPDRCDEVRSKRPIRHFLLHFANFHFVKAQIQKILREDSNSRSLQSGPSFDCIEHTWTIYQRVLPWFTNLTLLLYISPDEARELR